MRRIATLLARGLAWTVGRAPALLPVLRQVPWARGRAFVATFLSGDHMPAREIVARVNGLQYRLDLRDDVQRAIYFGAYAREFDAIRRLVPEGGICLDIGANVGAYALRFGQWVGDRGRVYAFEPDATIAARLRENVRLNALDKVVHVREEALSNQIGSATFFRSSPGHSGAGTLERFGKGWQSGSVSVQTTTVDAFLAAKGIADVAVMKVDVEAHELELLEGAREMLSQHRVVAVLIEYNGIRMAQVGKTYTDFMQAFARHGYYPVELRLDRIARIESGELDPATICVDFLFASSKHNGSHRSDLV